MIVSVIVPPTAVAESTIREARIVSPPAAVKTAVGPGDITLRCDSTQGRHLTTTVPPTAYYAAPVRRGPTCRIDVVGTLTALRRRGATTYQYLVANRWGNKSVQDWTDLPYFLKMARQFKIKVYVILLPPSEASRYITGGKSHGTCRSDNYPPYHGDYDRWFLEIGRLARTYPALVGSGMDDYPYNTTARPGDHCRAFAPDAPGRWQKIQSGKAGRFLPFAPTMYYGDLMAGNQITPGTINEFVWPFRALPTDTKLQLPVQYAKIKKKYPTAKIWIMVYASRTRYLLPDAKSVEREILAARRLRAQGSVVYMQRLSTY